MTETKELGRRSVLKALLGLGAVTMGASLLMGSGPAAAAEAPQPDVTPEPLDINEMAPDESKPETAETQYYVVRRRVYPRRRVVVVRRRVYPRRRVVVVRRRVYPRRRVIVVRRRRYW